MIPLNFYITSEEAQKIQKWNEGHRCKLKKNSGAIGGRLTYSFTPTSLGDIVKVTCGCGCDLDLTDYDW